MITYNKLPFLKKSLPAITNSVSGDVPVELIVLDNGSTDGTEEYLKMFAHTCPGAVEFRLFRVAENVGLNGYGIIAPLATGNIIVTADDDIFSVEPDGWERRFERVLASRFSGRKFGYVSTDTINSDGGRINDVVGIASLDELKIEVGPADGWFTATTKDVMSQVGGFHTGMPKMHLEDAEFQNKVWDAGYLVGTLLNTRVLHARSPRYYKMLGCEDTYREKAKLATEVGIGLERIA